MHAKLVALKKPLPATPNTGAAYWGEMSHPLDFSLAKTFGGRARPGLDEVTELSKKASMLDLKSMVSQLSRVIISECIPPLLPLLASFVVLYHFPAG